ncbi:MULTISPECIES: hypothetical protein [Azospirillum]|uniref:Uncharacterized protein n=1 Tax=Azospirillum brasilense TaxID=192 RepID=A0ABU4PFS6_AZOBR|nr:MULTISPECIES: hypothetical protein [Azospirillum]MDW7592280.1 hypothetical protein [Azospirillum brasilense]MDW7627410.1 hypothetical protein [Azospirillum brasilense]MDX5954901.1 hypothetical protein [Azospirillum brasilense]
MAVSDDGQNGERWHAASARATGPVNSLEFDHSWPFTGPATCRGPARNATPLPAPGAADAAKSIIANQNINRDLHEYPSMKVGSVIGQL